MMYLTSALKRIAQFFTRLSPLKQAEEATSACKELFRIILEEASPYAITAVIPDTPRSVPARYHFDGDSTYPVARVYTSQIWNQRHGTFPPKFNHRGLVGVKHRDAILFSQACCDAVYYFWGLIANDFLIDIIDRRETYWLTLRVIPQFDSYIPDQTPDGCYEYTTHTVMVIKLQSGPQLVIDITGIQFGFDELVVRLEEYRKKRAIPGTEEHWMKEGSVELLDWFDENKDEPWTSLRRTIDREVGRKWLALGKPRLKRKVVRDLQGVVRREIQKRR